MWLRPRTEDLLNQVVVVVLAGHESPVTKPKTVLGIPSGLAIADCL